MASSSSSSSFCEASPLLPPRQDSHDQEDAAAVAAEAPSGSGQQQQQEVMRSWAETMLCCCGADCGRLWRRVVLRKWLNVGAGSGDSDFSADEGDEDEDEPDHQDNCFCEHNLNDEERRLGGLGAGTIDQEIVIGAVVIKILPGKQVNNFSGNSYQGYESREVAEEKWRRHGRKKWRNFLVITTLLLFMVGYVFYFI